MTEVKGLGRFGAIIISFIFMCVLVVIGLQSATLHLHLHKDDEESTRPDSPSVYLPIHDFMRQTFPGRFFTDTEIEVFARSFANRTSPNLNASISEEFRPHCVDDYCVIDMIEVQTCCCQVITGFLSNTTAIDITGISRVLAQFQGNKQYFYTEKCTKTGTDPSCTCSPNPILASGVYVIDEKSRQYGIGYFYIGQTCFGLNT